MTVEEGEEEGCGCFFFFFSLVFAFSTPCKRPTAVLSVLSGPETFSKQECPERMGVEVIVENSARIIELPGKPWLTPAVEESVHGGSIRELILSCSHSSTALLNGV